MMLASTRKNIEVLKILYRDDIAFSRYNSLGEYDKPNDFLKNITEDDYLSMISYLHKIDKIVIHRHLFIGCFHGYQKIIHFFFIKKIIIYRLKR